MIDIEKMIDNLYDILLKDETKPIDIVLQANKIIDVIDNSHKSYYTVCEIMGYAVKELYISYQQLNNSYKDEINANFILEVLKKAYRCIQHCIEHNKTKSLLELGEALITYIADCRIERIKRIENQDVIWSYDETYKHKNSCDRCCGACDRNNNCKYKCTIHDLGCIDCINCKHSDRKYK